MAIKIYKVGEIVENEIILVKEGSLTRRRAMDSPVSKFARCLHIGIDIGINASDPNPDFKWKWGDEYFCLINKSDDLDNPILFSLINRITMIYFRYSLYLADVLNYNASEHEEISLRVKKMAYESEVEIVKLRSAVANLEAAVGFKKAGPKRTAIQEDVKLAVWARDGGACVRCGSKQSLHFDHIIPVSKGGSNSEANIQILCEHCNLQKSDKISF